MPQHNNSAARLLAILNAIPPQADSTQVASVWAGLFGINQENPHRQARLVAERLNRLSGELLIFRSGMSGAGYSESLYINAFNAFDAALSPLVLAATWNNVRQHLTSENLLALNFCAEILPDEENRIPEAEITKIGESIVELGGLVRGSSLPPELKEILLHQVALMQEAVRDYPISGSKALERALQAGVGEIIQSRENISEYRDTPEIKETLDVWKRFNEMAEFATKVDKLVQIGYRLGEFMSNVMSNLP